MRTNKKKKKTTTNIFKISKAFCFGCVKNKCKWPVMGLFGWF